MSIIRMLISLPIVIVILIFAFVNNQLITFNLWPFDIEMTVSFSVIVVVLILFGFVWAKISSWFAYLPLRKDLIFCKRQVNKLQKENQKVHKEFQGLKGSLNSKEDKSSTPDVEIIRTNEGLKNTLVRLFKSPKK